MYLFKYTKKGTLIGIDGRIRHVVTMIRMEKRVYITEVVVENLDLLEPKEKNTDNTQTDMYAPPQENFDTDSSIDISSDDLPF